MGDLAIAICTVNRQNSNFTLYGCDDAHYPYPLLYMQSDGENPNEHSTHMWIHAIRIPHSHSPKPWLTPYESFGKHHPYS